MPVGMPCPICSSLVYPRRAGYVHFATGIDIMQEDSWVLYDLETQGWPHAHALELSWDTLWLEPIIGYTSWHYTAPNTNYDPFYENPEVREVDDLLKMAKVLERHGVLMPDCFKRIKAATLADDKCIDDAIIYCGQMPAPIYTSEEREILQMNRRERAAQNQEDEADCLIETGDIHRCPILEEPVDPDAF